MIVDLARTCFDTDVAFDNAGTIVRRIRYFFAADGADVFKGFHLFGNGRDFTNHSCDELGPGETPSAIRTYYAGGLPAALPGQNGFCGLSDWWKNGVPSDTPALVYRRGVAVCCPAAPCQPVQFIGGGRHCTNDTTSVVWPEVIPGEFREPGGTGVFIRFQGVDSFPCANAVIPGARGSIWFLQKLTVPAFTIPMVCLSYDQPSATGTWTAPTAKKPYRGYTWSLTIPL